MIFLLGVLKQRLYVLRPELDTSSALVGGVAELVDARDSKSRSARVWVRVPPPPPFPGIVPILAPYLISAIFRAHRWKTQHVKARRS